MKEVYLDSSATVERLVATVKTNADPTGNVVSWQLTAESGNPTTGGWVAGTWTSAWNATTGRVETASPLTGTTGFTLTQESDVEVWVKFAAGVESPIIRRAGLVHVR